jgi:hypothetical protein
MVGLAAVSSWLALMLSAGPASGQIPSRAAGEDTIVELRGRVVCLGDGTVLRPCAAASDRFALETPGGGRYVFRPGDPLAGMFADDRIRERELFVRARKAPSEELEAIKLYSVRNGRLHDLDYFCEVCNVVAYAPGLCPCCRRPMVLRETPLP